MSPELKRKLAVLRGTMAAILLLGYGLDQWTKRWALNRLENGTGSSFFHGWLSIHLVHNPGAAFSLGSSMTIVFSLLSIAALVGVLGWGWPRAKNWPTAICAAMIVSGIAGNLTDRLTRPPGFMRGEVIDFIAVRHFAVFNVADVFISCSAIGFALYLLRRERLAAKSQKAGAAASAATQVTSTTSESGEDLAS